MGGGLQWIRRERKTQREKREKCEHRGREIRRDWWERGKMRGRVVSERNARKQRGEERRQERRGTKYISILFNKATGYEKSLA